MRFLGLKLLIAGVLSAALLLATPVGPWLAAGLLSRLAPRAGWVIEPGQVRGSVVGGMVLTGVRARDAANGLAIGVGRARLSLWPYAVELDDPEVAWQPTASGPDTSAAAVPDTAVNPLPVGSFPALTIRRGRFVYSDSDSLEVRAEGVGASYARGDSLGRLSLSAASFAVRQGPRSAVAGTLSGSADVEPRVLRLRQLRWEGTVDSLAASLEARGQLRLVAGLPVELHLDGRGRSDADSLELTVASEAQGTTEPVALRIRGRVETAHPTWGAGLLQAEGTVDTSQVQVDSLGASLIGGQLRGSGNYRFAANAVAAALELRHLDLGRIPGGEATGVLGGRLTGSADLGQRRFDAELEMTLAGLEAGIGQPVDAGLRARLLPDGGLRADLRSTLGALSAAGWMDPGKGYDLELSGEVAMAPLLGHPAPPVAMTGRARPDTLDLALRAADLPAGSGHLGPARLELSLRSWRYLEATLGLAGNRAGLRLSADLESSRIESGAGQIAALDLGQVAPPLRGMARGTVQASGSLRADALAAAAVLDLEGLGYGDWITDRLGLRLELQRGVATCALDGSGLQGQLTWNTSDMGCQGWLELAGARLHRRVAGVPDADSLGLLEVTGRLQWQATLDRLADARARADLERLVVRQGGWQVSAEEPVRLAYQDRRLAVQRAQLRTPIGVLGIDGQVLPDRLDLRAQVQELSLGALHPDLAGSGWLRLEAFGSPARPQVRGELEAGNVSLAGRALGDVRLRAALADSLAAELTVRQGTPASGGTADRSGLDLTVRAPAEPLWTGALTSSAQRLQASLAARQLDLRVPLSYAWGDSVNGVVSLDGHLDAPVALLADPRRWPEARGELRLEQLGLNKQGLALELQPGAEARMADGRVVLRGVDTRFELREEDEAPHPAGRLTVAGQLSRGEPAQLSLAVEGLDLAVLERLGPRTTELTRGTADFEAHLTGTTEHPEADALLQVRTEDLGRLDGRFHGSADRATARVSWTTVLGDSLLVAAELPWDLERGVAQWGRGHLEARSDRLDLRALLDLMPFLEAIQGSARVAVSVDGFAASPRLAGGVELSDLRLRLLDTKPDYVFPSGRLSFTGSRGELADFAGRSERGQGQIDVTGFLDLTTPARPAYEVRAQVENLPYTYLDVFDAPDIDGQVTLGSTPTGALLQGRVRINGAVSEPELIDLRAPALPPPPAAVQNPFLETLDLDVFTDVRDLRVKNELADLRLEGGITTYGTFYKPRFQGGLEVTEGTAFVLSREFTFRKGRINLDHLVPTYSVLDLAYDPLLLDPQLDLELSATVRPIEETESDYQVTLQLEGPVRKVVPRFSSEPTLGDTEILTLLAFGSTSPANYRGALYTAAGQLLLSKQVEKIGLDEFQVLPSGTVLNTVGQPSVRLSKHFAYPVPFWVRYEAATAEPAFGEFRLEYKLKSYLTLTGVAQSEYDRYGLGLGLKKDY